MRGRVGVLGDIDCVGGFLWMMDWRMDWCGCGDGTKSDGGDGHALRVRLKSVRAWRCWDLKSSPDGEEANGRKV